MLQNLNLAIDYAKSCETSASNNSKSQIPPVPGSRIYKLIEALNIK